MHRFKFAGIAVLSLALASCENSNSRDAAADAAAAANEVEFTSSAPGTGLSPSAEIPTGGKPTNPEAENTVKAFINLNGQLCAQIVSVRPLAMANTAEVTCIEYTGGSSRVTYIINLQSGELQKAG